MNRSSQVPIEETLALKNNDQKMREAHMAYFDAFFAQNPVDKIPSADSKKAVYYQLDLSKLGLGLTGVLTCIPDKEADGFTCVYDQDTDYGDLLVNEKIADKTNPYLLLVYHGLAVYQKSFLSAQSSLYEEYSGKIENILGSENTLQE